MVDAVTTNTANAKINSGQTMLASNFETFLSLLTAQLKNQDPLSPVDSNEFTAQLTQMAGVEQQLMTNSLLTALLDKQSSGGMSDAANYIGRDAAAVWPTTELTNGEARWSYERAADAAKVTMSVVDGSGKTVWTGDAPDKTTGIHDFTWDGKTTGGGQMDDGGVYTLKITATNATGQAVTSQALIRGEVTGVELYNGVPYVTIGDAIMPLSSLISLQQKAATPAPTPDTENPDA